MKPQLALDLVNIPQAKELVKEVEAYVDIVEIGTPVVINEGLRAVKEIKEAFPNLQVLADLKIMDAGGYEVMKASEAGADIITVLGVSDDSTILGAVQEARKQNKKIMVDMINVKNMEERAQEIDALGVDYICVHSGYDHQADREKLLRGAVGHQARGETGENRHCRRHKAGHLTGSHSSEAGSRHRRRRHHQPDRQAGGCG